MKKSIKAKINNMKKMFPNLQYVVMYHDGTCYRKFEAPTLEEAKAFALKYKIWTIGFGITVIEQSIN